MKEFLVVASAFLLSVIGLIAGAVIFLTWRLPVS